eukprot:scaffold36777_cov199-Amphora_coffeaeformis.AAC.3
MTPHDEWVVAVWVDVDWVGLVPVATSVDLPERPWRLDRKGKGYPHLRQPSSCSSLSSSPSLFRGRMKEAWSPRDRRRLDHRGRDVCLYLYRDTPRVFRRRHSPGRLSCCMYVRSLPRSPTTPSGTILLVCFDGVEQFRLALLSIIIKERL